MSKTLRIGIGILVTVGAIVALPRQSEAADFVVYSVFKPLSMGEPGENPQKDYYINMGSAHGLGPGATVEVMRRTPTYDLIGQKLYKDVTFPIARLKVIHVEPNAAVARLDKMLPEEKMPAIYPGAVMVGDLIRPAGQGM